MNGISSIDNSLQSLDTGLTKEVQLAIANIYLPKGNTKIKEKGKEGRRRKIRHAVFVVRSAYWLRVIIIIIYKGKRSI